MKNIVNLLGTIIIGLSCALWLSGCGGGDDHAGHDHDHDHEHGEEHHEEAASAANNAANQIAGAISEAANTAADTANQLAEDVNKMTDEAIIAAQSATYPLKTCVVSGEELGSMGESVNYVHEGTLIKLCCDHCKPDLDKDPSKFVAMVKEAIAK